MPVIKEYAVYEKFLTHNFAAVIYLFVLRDLNYEGV